jgi:acyl carrier protein
MEGEIKLVADSVRQFIVGNFPSARRRVLGNDDPLLENGIVDSMGVLDIVNFLESEFGIVASDDELIPENFRTVQSIAGYVERKQNG